MLALNKLYRPITSQPFRNNDTYIEIQPCEELKPYICCFWGMPRPYTRSDTEEIQHGLVIPDTCMDIIFNIDMDKNEINDVFTGINDTSFHIQSNNFSGTFSCFAIRFYFWAVPLFCDESLKKTLNAFAETEVYFKNFRRDFQDILINNSLITERIAKAEQYLLKKLNLRRQNNIVMNAVYKLIKSKGKTSISELVEYTTVSQRQLERLFLEYVGVSPKRLSGLIRYQNLWQDILTNSNINMQDAVLKYGYTDQAHLLNDFKKYHLMTPKQAKIFAYKSR
ncbi:MAG: helix-turn-helix domain-containing protein [Bacillota bacterium]|nr:helix-turn-helix domain-containing protein [Bacillota bacterium]